MCGKGRPGGVVYYKCLAETAHRYRSRAGHGQKMMKVSNLTAHWPNTDSIKAKKTCPGDVPVMVIPARQSASR